jgi:hypothetical protein
MPAMTKIHVLFHDAGGGHRNAAVALQTICKEQNRPWDVELVQFQDLTDHLDVLKKLTGIQIQEQYNILLRNGWTLGRDATLMGAAGDHSAFLPPVGEIAGQLFSRASGRHVDFGNSPF